MDPAAIAIRSSGPPTAGSESKSNSPSSISAMSVKRRPRASRRIMRAFICAMRIDSASSVSSLSWRMVSMLVRCSCNCPVRPLSSSVLMPDPVLDACQEPAANPTPMIRVATTAMLRPAVTPVKLICRVDPNPLPKITTFMLYVPDASMKLALVYGKLRSHS